jgi:hypothetical protein
MGWAGRIWDLLTVVVRMQLEDIGETIFSGSETYEEKDAMFRYLSVVHTAQ